MDIRKYFVLSLIVFVIGHKFGHAQIIARLALNDVKNEIEAPVFVDLDTLTSLPDSSLILYKVDGQTKTPVSFQIENGYHRFLWWNVKKEKTTNDQVYELWKGNRPDINKPSVQITKKDGQLLITEDGKNVLQYNCKTVYPPKGVDTIFKRSGFIHPLWSPSGHVLTRINPPDHYHHVGIWNPWTHVLFQGKVVDFWNLVKGEGTVRFADFISKTEGPVYGGFKALQKHVVLNDPKGEKVALNEVWDIRVYNIGPKMWLWDFTSTLNCATPDPVILEEYRYGGFGFRATGDWNNQNSKILTSEGKTRKEADATRARWCMIDGDVDGGHSGILFMDYPTNYNFPEPMRVWPVNANKRGDVFFSFSPTRNMDWPLYPDKSYVLKYRMLVYEGTISKEQAENVWQSFAHPPGITVTKRVNDQ